MGKMTIYHWRGRKHLLTGFDSPFQSSLGIEREIFGAIWILREHSEGVEFLDDIDLTIIFPGKGRGYERGTGNRDSLDSGFFFRSLRGYGRTPGWDWVFSLFVF